jgi:uncharacterized protein (DUF362 family)
MIREALSALGEAFQERVRKAQSVFVHPNLVTHHRKESNTDVEAVRGVIDHLSLMRGDAMLVGDASVHNTKKAFKKLNYETLTRSGNVKLVDLNDDETVPSFAYTKEFTKRPIGFSKLVAESDCTIVVVPAKMHLYTLVSLSVKTHVVGSQVVRRTPFGIYARWPWNHTGYPQIHKTLADVYAERPASVAVIDGTQAMEGDGPSHGNTVNLGWVIASLNPVAADALAVYLMGLDPLSVGYLALLNEKGFGPIEVSAMDVIGAKPEKLVYMMKRPSSFPGVAAWRT